MIEWLTPQRVAKNTGRHIDTVLRALQSGELHGHQRKRRGHWSVHPDAVDAWVKGMNGIAACGCQQLLIAKRPAHAIAL